MADGPVAYPNTLPAPLANVLAIAASAGALWWGLQLLRRAIDVHDLLGATASARVSMTPIRCDRAL
jgi:hypothetical protein